jgi:Pyruvate/2-oxoacid:ferredoxin oxidoreductase gamma subunit
MLKYAITTAVMFLLPTLANAADGARYLDLAKCMTFATVKGGLDGKKPVPKDYADVISVLGEEYMFEATALGMDDNEAQTFIVNELIRQNRIKEEQGMDALTAELGETCSVLAGKLISDEQTK